MTARHWQIGSWALALLLISPLLALVGEALASEYRLFMQLWQTVLWDYIRNTLLLVLGVGGLTLLLGVPAGWLLARCALPGRGVLSWALMLPLAMPAYIVAYLYTDLLDYPGVVQGTLRGLFGWQTPADYWFPAIRSLGGASLILALVLFPYVYLLSRTAFLELSASLTQSGRLLGASPWRCFWRITLPLVRPALVVALSLVAMETLADYGTVSYFAVATLTTAVNDTWLGYGSLNGAAQIALCLLGIVLLLLTLERISRRRQQVFQKGMGLERQPLLPLPGWRGWLAAGYCWTLVLAGFGLPLGRLLGYAWLHGGDSLNALVEVSLNSLTVALLAAGLATLLAALLVFAHRLNPGAASGLPLRLAGFGYAMPGTVLAIGVLAPLTFLDFRLNELLAALGFEEPGLVLSGSLLALVLAYVVRFLAVPLGSLDSSFARISPSLDMVTRTLGEGPGGLLRRVHLPLVRKGMLAGLLLVFIESMKELPAALLLRPFNFETLATQVYQLVKGEQLEQGAWLAILIVLVGLLPLVFVNRYLEPERG